MVNILFGGKWGGGGGDFGTKYMLLVHTLIDYTRLIKNEFYALITRQKGQKASVDEID